MLGRKKLDLIVKTGESLKYRRKEKNHKEKEISVLFSHNPQA